jgi:hypothetical protein
VKALTLHQPWATAIAEGIKAIETRSWSTAYRGPLAIHAGKRDVIHGWNIGEWRTYRADRADRPNAQPARMYHRSTGWATRPEVPVVLPLGAVVATAVLVDVVPIGGPTSFSTGIFEGATPPTAGMDVVVHHEAFGDWVRELLVLDRWNGPTEDISRELPWGDFTPGRWAWLLDDIVKLAEPITARGRQGLWEWDESGVAA